MVTRVKEYVTRQKTDVYISACDWTIRKVVGGEGKGEWGKIKTKKISSGNY